MTLSAFRLGRLIVSPRVNPFRNARAFHDYSNELGYPIPSKEPKWTTADEAMEILKSDMFVFVHGAAATPVNLLEAMVKRGKASSLKNITVGHMHTEGKAPQVDPECEGMFRDLSFFMGGNIRKAVEAGRADNLSIFLHEIPLTFHRGLYKPDIALIHVSPPDRHGYVTLGTSVDCARAACTYAKYIIAQVNPQMPRTFGDTHIHISHIDYAVCVDTKLPEHGDKPLTDVDKAIGKHIADNLVEDGATLQMGIGNIPDAVLDQLHLHKFLGIHSEMFANGVVELVAAGAVTNCQKPTHRGRTVGSFVNGTQRLYDWINDNPSVAMMRVDYVNAAHAIRSMPKMTAINSAIEVDLTGQVNKDSIGIGNIPDAVLDQLHLHKFLGIHSEMFANGVVELVAAGAVTNCQKPTHRGRTVGSFVNGTQRLYDWINDNPSVAMMRVDYVNAAHAIRSMPKMTAINSAIEIDLTGQVNADSIGTRMYSGFGGQVDFIRGAGEAVDMKGKPIIALSSVTKKGESKIVPFLKEGAGVVTSRAHNQYVVTEYGIASLWAKSLRQKAYQLIQIAHPDHRERLEKAAFERMKCMPSPN